LDLLCSCDLDFDQMTFIYELDPYPFEIYELCENELPTSRLSKVIILQTYRQTDRRTDRQRLIERPRCIQSSAVKTLNGHYEVRGVSPVGEEKVYAGKDCQRVKS